MARKYLHSGEAEAYRGYIVLREQDTYRVFKAGVALTGTYRTLCAAQAGVDERILNPPAVPVWHSVDAVRPPVGLVLLYFPEDAGGGLGAMIQLGYARGYPHRPPTHWAPLPEPPP